MSALAGALVRAVGATAALLLFLFPCTRARAQQQAAAPNAFEIVFIGEAGPLFLRITPRIAERSLPAHFDAYLKKWFDFLDTNQDRKLEGDEFTGALKASAMAQLLGSSLSGPPQASLTPADLKKASGTAATFDDFARYYQRNNIRALRVMPTFRGARYADRAGEALFRMLDTNQDGKLSREEVAAAPLLMKKLDLDDDELISADELAPASNLAMSGARPGMAMKTDTQSSLGMAFYPLVTQGDRERVPEILLSLFDKDEDNKLNPRECGFDADTFARLDKNKDGALDEDELAEWIKGPADFEFVLDFPQAGLTLRSPAQADRGVRLSLKSAAKRVDKHHQRVSPVSCVLGWGDAEITVTGLSDPEQGQEYLQQFQAADKDERGYVVAADLEAPEFKLLKDIFATVDRNRDGRMTRDELTRFSAVQDGAPRATLAIVERGRALFHLLDANRDGRLSEAELRGAWTRLEALDVDKKGHVTAEQITRQFHIVIAQGPPQAISRTGGPDVQLAAGRLSGAHFPKEVPEWFRRMDANGDGYVSAREFLGTRADFGRIDTNGDGLIDPQEAIRFDALTRQKQKR